MNYRLESITERTVLALGIALLVLLGGFSGAPFAEAKSTNTGKLYTITQNTKVAVEQGEVHAQFATVKLLPQKQDTYLNTVKIEVTPKNKKITTKPWETFKDGTLWVDGVMLRNINLSSKKAWTVTKSKAGVTTYAVTVSNLNVKISAGKSLTLLPTVSLNKNARVGDEWIISIPKNGVVAWTKKYGSKTYGDNANVARITVNEAPVVPPLSVEYKELYAGRANDQIRYTVSFEVTANNDDIFLSADSGKLFRIEKDAEKYVGQVVSSFNSSTADKIVDPYGNIFYEVEEGDSETFKLEVLVTPLASGTYMLVIPGIEYRSVPNGIYEGTLYTEGQFRSGPVIWKVDAIPPTMTLRAYPAQVAPGEPSAIKWTSTNANYCTEGGKVDVQGTYNTDPLYATTTFTLTCVGFGGSVTQTVTITVVAPDKNIPVITNSALIRVSPAPIAYLKSGVTEYVFKPWETPLFRWDRSFTFNDSAQCFVTLMYDDKTFEESYENTGEGRDHIGFYAPIMSEFGILEDIQIKCKSSKASFSAEASISTNGPTGIGELTLESVSEPYSNGGKALSYTQALELCYKFAYRTQEDTTCVWKGVLIGQIKTYGEGVQSLTAFFNGFNTPQTPTGEISTLTVITPNGGEKIVLKETKFIRAKKSGLSSISIALYKNDTLAQWIVQDLAIGDQSDPMIEYGWTPGQGWNGPEDSSAGDVYKIYIIGQRADGQGYVDDKSDTSFRFVNTSQSNSFSPWGQTLGVEDAHVPEGSFRAFVFNRDSNGNPATITRQAVIEEPYLNYLSRGGSGASLDKQIGAYFVGKFTYGNPSPPIEFEMSDPQWDVVRLYIDGKLVHTYGDHMGTPTYTHIFAGGTHTFEIEYESRWHAGTFAMRIGRMPFPGPVAANSITSTLNSLQQQYGSLNVIGASVYESSDEINGDIQLTLPTLSSPTVLVVSSYDPVRWRWQGGPPEGWQNVKAIIVYSYAGGSAVDQVVGIPVYLVRDVSIERNKAALERHIERSIDSYATAYAPMSLTLPAMGVEHSTPTLTLTASPTTVSFGQTTTISWSSTNATSCKKTIGIYDTLIPLSGTDIAPPATTTTLSITCTGAGGSVTKSVTVTVEPKNVPKTDFGILSSCFYIDVALNESCKKADFNADGVVDMFDLSHFDGARVYDLSGDSIVDGRGEWTVDHTEISEDQRIFMHCHLRPISENPSCTTSDFNGNGVVNTNDYRLFKMAVLKYDLNGDSVIDLVAE